MSETRTDGRPSIWGGVPPRNPHFTGRADLLEDLHERFSDGSVPVVMAAIGGMFGSGKTQLAIEYVYRYLSEYDAVWWVPATDEAAIRRSLADLANLLEVDLRDREEPADIVQAIVGGLPTSQWLMVFDAADEVDAVSPFLPRGAGHVLITARSSLPDLGVNSVPVDVLSREESIAYLCQRRPALLEFEADLLAQVLGDMPLALSSAVSYLNEADRSADEYLEEFEAARVELLEGMGEGRFSPLEVPWALLLSRVADDSPATFWLLRLFSFFEADRVDRALLRPVADPDVPPELGRALRDRRTMARALRTINRYGLAKVDNRANTLQLHALVRARLAEGLTSREAAMLTRLAETLEGRVGTDVDWSTDAPAEIDLLKRDALAEVLTGRLRETRRRDPRTSFLVHLDGAWGSGKSTLLHLLGRRLSTAGFLVVWFDAWQHSRLSPPWWALLTTLRQDIARDRSWWARRWLYVRETLERARRSGAPYLLALIVLAVLAGGIGLLVKWALGNAQPVGDLLKTVGPVVTALGVLWAGARVAGRVLLWDSARGARLFEQSDTNPMMRVAEHFDWLLRRSRKPVVFFIDDLDRCQDEYVVELLEAVQTLVRDAPRIRPGVEDLPSAAFFVVAADGSWLRRAYTSQYGDADLLGYQFLEKLFQLTVPMPSLSAATQRHFLGGLLGLKTDASSADSRRIAEARSRVEAATGDEDLILESLLDTPPELRDTVVTDAARAFDAAETRAHTEHTLRKFAPMLSPNPRSTKLFLNTYTIMRAVRTLEGITVDGDTLALWTIIRIRWPSIAHFLERNPDAVKGILEPLWCSDLFPAELQETARSEELRSVVGHPEGGPLTAVAIRHCCGSG
ncbi:FxSxx-COOH system tetratricopeptide repeat protein [Amycolatopsis sp., V23-08]|uniref:FxSxx-COOH system tetratricopeptide repeat protein n=1 Tax=Amycolatopsis heterodermiae TaxID=3110235 RepID=A0ABU5RJ42_9PSEU|nr:FxSxx-COOH system tetratricopeptide repeat protein [Amycolatopsis sp., V23-08]MEA5366313.1 FxSxx-COOH system tetratricopeptide repeat protein [Amycolatopsis sp., V23-08]